MTKLQQIAFGVTFVRIPAIFKFLNRLVLAAGLCFWLACSSGIKHYTFLPRSDSEIENTKTVLTVKEGFTLEIEFLSEKKWDAYFARLGRNAGIFKNFFREVSKRKEVRKLKSFYLFEIKIDNRTGHQAIFTPLNTFLKSKQGRWPAYTLTDLLLEENSETLPTNSYKDYFFDTEVVLSPGKSVKKMLIFKWPFEDIDDPTLIFYDLYLNGRSYDLEQQYDKIEIPNKNDT